MRSSKGFTLIEALVAMGIIMMLVLTIGPLYILIKQERHIQFEKRTVNAVLHDDLQLYIWNGEGNDRYNKEVEGVDVYFQFKDKNDQLEGCARWENNKGREEEICLYGIVDE